MSLEQWNVFFSHKRTVLSVSLYIGSTKQLYGFSSEKDVEWRKNMELSGQTFGWNGGSRDLPRCKRISGPGRTAAIETKNFESAGAEGREECYGKLETLPIYRCLIATRAS